jgi:hypothetical protein
MTLTDFAATRTHEEETRRLPREQIREERERERERERKREWMKFKET